MPTLLDSDANQPHQRQEFQNSVHDGLVIVLCLCQRRRQLDADEGGSEMTVAELIAELQKHPSHMPVTAFIPDFSGDNEAGMFCIEMGEGDSREVTDVKFSGRFIALEADGMVR